MIEYEGVSEKERYASLRLTKKAIADGVIPKPHTCEPCGKTTGRIDYHNETYASPTKDLTMICQGCHGLWHKMETSPPSFYKRFISTGNYKKIKNKIMQGKIRAFIAGYEACKKLEISN